MVRCVRASWALSSRSMTTASSASRHVFFMTTVHDVQIVQCTSTAKEIFQIIEILGNQDSLCVSSSTEPIRIGILPRHPSSALCAEKHDRAH
ncbi:hypothetical protein SCHPADRAFT_504344 [Schizopora paradoxa]|uniref:Uncharacterized protein n=1 Tax=Schizopora paradoxa TaxID=27342 RepID=A0A0H2S136_9AGAM|nr:hypothetical protein SCHPADRAFT_504344 [Schizopora paradoxa]